MMFAFAVASGVDAPGRVRRQLRERLDPLLDRATARDLELLISEVVTNAVRYAGAERDDDIEVRVELDSELINVHIVDSGPGFAPAARRGPRFDRNPGGFGLFLLDLLSTRWGVERDEQGFRVWFRLARAEPASAEP